MKTSINLLIASSLIVTGLPALAVPGNGNGNGASHGDPYTPIGTLDVSARHGARGYQPTLSWEITYPATAPDLVTIHPSGKVTTKEELRVTMRVAGVAFQSGTTELPVGFWSKVGGSGWTQNFYGTGSQVQSDNVVFDQIVPAGTDIDLAGRARKSNGGWYDIRWTSQPDVAVTGLVNGQAVPDYAPAYAQGDIESFLSAYIGHPNNGHGNNADGVDVSNPGQGTGGPNGEIDLSGAYDDESGPVATIGPRDMIYLFELASRDPGEWWFDMQDLVVIVTYEQTSTNAP